MPTSRSQVDRERLTTFQLTVQTDLSHALEACQPGMNRRQQSQEAAISEPMEMNGHPASRTQVVPNPRAACESVGAVPGKGKLIFSRHIAPEASNSFLRVAILAPSAFMSMLVSRAFGNISSCSSLT